jgi:8-oxo-dGTP pyrophosphatase MutT (NUDIX family)
LKLEFNFDQSGVIPYRKINDGIEILLITSVRKKKWIIPKGYVEFNLSPFDSAKKEAFEEAGIIGSNETVELGTIHLKKDSGNTRLKIYSMEVVKILEDYPDKELRKRKWFTIKEAAEKVTVPEISDMINSLTLRIR